MAFPGVPVDKARVAAIKAAIAKAKANGETDKIKTLETELYMIENSFDALVPEMSGLLDAFAARRNG